MTVQRNQNRHPNFLRGAKHQLMLLGGRTLRSTRFYYSSDRGIFIFNFLGLMSVD